MATPTLKYVAPTIPEADLSLAPEPVVIYGVPTGGGGGGGDVASVNGQTGTVVLKLDDVVAAGGAIGGKNIDVADNLTSPQAIVTLSSGSIRARNVPGSSSVSVSSAGVTFSAPGVTGSIVPPESGTDSLVALPSASGTLALTSEIPANATDIGAATAAQGAKADTAVQPSALATYVPNTRTVAGKPLSGNVSLDKIDVGLSNVDNISAANAPVSTATQTALNLKANTADVVPSTRTVAGKALSSNVTLVKGDVGLGNVDNTADSAKPISTATQTALNAKVGSPNSTITGVAYYPTVASLPTTGTAGVIYYVDAV